MKPVRTQQSNHGWGAPHGQEDSISMLPVEIVHEDQGEVHYSIWELSEPERKAIANGYNIRLGVTWIGGMPPVSLGVTHCNRENGCVIE